MCSSKILSFEVLLLLALLLGSGCPGAGHAQEESGTSGGQDVVRGDVARVNLTDVNLGLSSLELKAHGKGWGKKLKESIKKMFRSSAKSIESDCGSWKSMLPFNSVQDDILKIGSVMRNKKKIPIEIVFMGVSDLDNVLNLEEEVFNKLQDKSQLYFLTKEFLKDHLFEGSFVLGIKSQNKLVAFLLLDFPKDNDPFHLGKLYGLSKSEQQLTVHFTMYVVHPEYRGFHFAKILNQEALKLLKLGPYKHALATVAPGNFPSIMTLLKGGFRIMRYRPDMYHDKNGTPLERLVFYRHIHKEEPVIAKDKAILVDLNDKATQRELLDDGNEGFDIIVNKKEAQQTRSRGVFPSAKIVFGRREPKNLKTWLSSLGKKDEARASDGSK